MALLLDTHAFIWWLVGSVKLPTQVRDAVALEDTEILVSAASAWEIATKHTLGKLPEADAWADDISGTISRQGFSTLDISMKHAEVAGRLPLHHRDPFDRMLIAQGLSEGLTLVSNESLFDQYGVTRLW